LRTPRDAIYDELLVLRCRQGERAAVDELLRRWERRLLYYVRRLVDDDEHDAWDVLQQTFLQAVRKLHTLREPRTLPAWLYTIARNAALADRRRRSALASGGRGTDDAVEVGELAASAAAAGPDDGGEFTADDVDAVHAAMGELSVPHREALTLLFLQDLSVEEIAQVVGASPGTVKSRVYYAKRALRAILERQGVGHG
jgi:RNA polymerase sigma-70 factor (ECF subfamily)